MYFCLMAKYTLQKKEILSGKKQISELFASETSLFHYPFKVFYKIIRRPDPKDSGILFSVSVPKRNFKKAHDRNLIKRRIRESFRLNKNEFISLVNHEDQMVMMLVFIGNKMETYQIIDRAMLGVIYGFRKLIVK